MSRGLKLLALYAIAISVVIIMVDIRKMRCEYLHEPVCASPITGKSMVLFLGTKQ